LIPTSAPHGGGVHGKPAGRLQNATSHHVRRAAHSRVLIVEAARILSRLRSVEPVGWNELDECCQTVDRNDGDVSPRVVRHATPMCAADVRRNDERSLETRRCERAVVAQRTDLREASVALGGCGPPHAVERECVR
jgi:hypothetical protein